MSAFQAEDRGFKSPRGDQNCIKGELVQRSRTSGFQSEDEGSIPSFPSIREMEKWLSRRSHNPEFRVRLPASLPLFVMPYKGPKSNASINTKENIVG